VADQEEATSTSGYYWTVAVAIIGKKHGFALYRQEHTVMLLLQINGILGLSQVWLTRPLGNAAWILKSGFNWVFGNMNQKIRL
jgi:hypothetical protein